MARNVDVPRFRIDLEMGGIRTRGLENPLFPGIRRNVGDFPGERNERVRGGVAVFLDRFESPRREFGPHEIPELPYRHEPFRRVFQKVRKDHFGPVEPELREKRRVRGFQDVFFRKPAFLGIGREMEFVVVKIRKEVAVRVRDDDVWDVAGFGMPECTSRNSVKAGFDR